MQWIRTTRTAGLLRRAPSSIALRNSSLFAKGEGLFGALGTGHFEDLKQFTEINSKGFIPQKAVAGWGHSAVITKEGQLYIFGRPYDFQTLMRLNHINTAAPMMARLASKMSSFLGPESGVFPSPVLLQIDEPIKDVACSAGLTVFCTESGQVLCMGSNRWGQCGINQTDALHVYVPLAVRGLQGESANHVAGGLQHSACCTASGRVFTWGKAERGQLGHGSTDNSHTPVLVSLPEAATAIAAGLNHMAALTESGKVYVWGKQMSTTIKTKGVVTDLFEDQLTPRLAELPEGTAAIAVVCSNFHTVIHTNGKLYAMGLSEASRSMYSQPVLVEGVEELSTEGGIASLRKGFNRVIVMTGRGKPYEVVVAADRCYLAPFDVSFAGQLPSEGPSYMISDISTGWKHSLLILQERNTVNAV